MKEIYDRIATEEDIEKVSEILKNNKEPLWNENNVYIDPKSFAPFVVYDRIRFDIEAIQDPSTTK